MFQKHIFHVLYNQLIPFPLVFQTCPWYCSVSCNPFSHSRYYMHKSSVCECAPSTLSVTPYLLPCFRKQVFNLQQFWFIIEGHKVNIIPCRMCQIGPSLSGMRIDYSWWWNAKTEDTVYFFLQVEHRLLSLMPRILPILYASSPNK